MMSRNISYSAYSAIRALAPNRSSGRYVKAKAKYLSFNTKLWRGIYSYVLLEKTTPRRFVPENIQKPPYALTGRVPPKSNEVEIKTEEQIELMRKTCRLARKILDDTECYLEVGMTTDKIDEIVHEMCIENGAYPSPLNYNGFPKSVCTSVNNVACHGIPDLRPLEDGDIINIDITVYKNGVHGDLSRTFMIGNVDEDGKRLVEATERSLYAGISQCKPGQCFKAIGTAISECATEAGFKVIPAFTGHGIGSYFHGLPDIYHIPLELVSDGLMQEGMTFTVEPILSEGTDFVAILEEDGWTAVSEDGSRSAQFEHTILITSNGYEILTDL